jgi:DNA-binding IclR family transcriptional regulator
VPEPELELARVAGLSGLPPHRAEQLLEGLVDVHLLQEAGPRTYRMHALLRHYAAGLSAGPVVAAPAAVPG